MDTDNNERELTEIEKKIMGFSDSTTVLEVQQYIYHDNGHLLGDSALFDEVNQFITTALTDKSLGDAELLEKSKELCERFTRQFNIAAQAVGGTFVGYARMRGHLYIIQKKLVKRSGQQWGQWLKSNSDVSDNTVMKYIKLAERQDSIGYEHLGVEELNMVIDATANRKSDNPIGDFMDEYGIIIDPGKPPKVKDFKKMVDAALSMETLKRDGATQVNYDKVKELYDADKKIDSGRVKELIDIEKDGNDPNVRIQRWINGEPDDTPFDKGKQVESFKLLSRQLRTTLDYMLEYRELVDLVELDDIEKLEAALAIFKNKITGRENETPGGQTTMTVSQ